MHNRGTCGTRYSCATVRLGARTLGIAAAYPAPLARLPALRERLRAPQARWPGAEELAQDLITLPTHDGVTMSDQERILAWLKSQSGDVQRTYSVRAGQQPVAASLLIL
jgi:dTDP-4-amino-4,6-dideoxygalactose transaminase